MMVIQIVLEIPADRKVSDCILAQEVAEAKNTGKII